MIPFEELAASGIDRSTAARLNYRCTPDGGWEIPNLDPQGQPYTYGESIPFVRRKREPGSDPKYLTPKGAGNRPYFSPLLPKGYLEGTKILLITEGEKKADALTAQGFPCVRLTGAWGWKDSRGGNAILELREINRNRPINIAFDSDVVIKPQILDAMSVLASWIQAPKDDGVFYGPGDAPNVAFIPSERNGEKNGADDFIVRHGADAFARLLRLARPAWIWKGSKNPKRENPPHPSLPGLSTAPIGSAHDVEFYEDVLYWGPPTALDASD